MYKKGHYQYPWPVTKETIRLLSICPPQYADPSKLELLIVTFRLDNLPVFNALSYTWGPTEYGSREYTDNDKVCISVNGLKFYIYPNAFDALLQLRETCPNDYVWVDAVCINQDDLAERASQISIMDSIYSDASQVVIWLGKPAKGMRQLMDHFHHLTSMSMSDYLEAKEEIARLDEHTMLVPGTSGDLALRRFGLPIPSSPTWEMVHAFGRKRWFTRLWVIQEAALAKEFLLLCGRFRLSWHAIFRSKEIFHGTRLWHTVAARSHLARGTALSHLADIYSSVFIGGDASGVASPTTKGPQASEVTQTTPIDSIMKLRSWLLPGVVGCGMNLPKEDSVDHNITELVIRHLTGVSDITCYSILFYLCWSNKGVPATDERDKVYSFLGLLNRLSKVTNYKPMDIVPDYGPSSKLSTILENMTKKVIKQAGNYAVLAAVNPLVQRRLTDLPSWVPDFSCVPETFSRQTLAMVYPKFNAGYSPNLPNWSVEMSRRNLLVHAVKVGQIKELIIMDYSNVTFNPLLTYDGASKFLGLLDEVYPFTGQSRIEAFWRTLVLDCVHWKRPAPNSIGVMFDYKIREVILSQFAMFGLDDEDKLESLACNNLLLESSKNKIREILQSRELRILEDSEMRATLMKILKDWENISNGYEDNLDGVLSDRRVFLTDTGYLGTAQTGVQIGDDVYVVASCPSPLVIRQDPSSGSRVIMSVAYVHGIMDGEILRGKPNLSEIWIS
jgi:hypothetical protein